MSYVKIGVAGPVGSGKTALIEAITRLMVDDYSLCVVTKTIFIQLKMHATWLKTVNYPQIEL